MMQQPDMGFKSALDNAVESLLDIHGQIVMHEGREFESPKRWIICFLGSLLNIWHFNRTSHDPFVNIIFVVIADEHIDED